MNNREFSEFFDRLGVVRDKEGLKVLKDFYRKTKEKSKNEKRTDSRVIINNDDITNY